MGANYKYYTYKMLLEELNEYSSPKAKVTNLIKSGKLIKIKRNLFLKTDESDMPVNTLANIIFGPSYISFEYALSYYGIIPERSEIISSAVYNKTKNKIFKTPQGIFEYRYINKKVYPYGIIQTNENDITYLIASREKAVCDTLSKIRSVESFKNLEYLLFEDLRFDESIISKLNFNDIEFYSKIYHQKNISLLTKYLRKVNKK